MKLGVSHQRSEMLTPEHLLYLRQMGVECLEVRIPAQYSNYENLIRIRDKVEKTGLNVFEIMLSDKYNSREIALGLPSRDEEITHFKSFIKDLARAGINCTTYAWHTGGTYATGRTTTRNCQTRLFQLEEALRKPNAYEREYSDEEMWDNYKYFITEVLPVAEDAGVRLQLHPNDPPVTHQGVARIFRSTDAFKRAMDISCHSAYSGILFCVGTWAEMFGPNNKGEDVVEAIREFGAKGQIYQVHFRNISSSLPDFHETFPDNGYLNMYEIMTALGEVSFDGMVVPDHVPVCSGSEAGPKTGEAFSLGYIRALMQAVQTDFSHTSTIG